MPTPPLPKPAPDLARGRLTLLTLLRNPVLSLVLPILCLVVMGLYFFGMGAISSLTTAGAVLLGVGWALMALGVASNAVSVGALARAYPRVGGGMVAWIVVGGLAVPTIGMVLTVVAPAFRSYDALTTADATGLPAGFALFLIAVILPATLQLGAVTAVSTVRRRWGAAAVDPLLAFQEAQLGQQDEFLAQYFPPPQPSQAQPQYLQQPPYAPQPYPAQQQPSPAQQQPYAPQPYPQHYQHPQQ